MSVRGSAGRLVVLVLATVFLLPGFGVPTERAHAAVSIRVDHDLVSVDADHVEWRELLAEFTRRTGIALYVQDDLVGRLSVSFRDLPVERALKRLFGTEASFVLSYQGPPAAPLPFEVRIFPGGPHRPASWSAPDASSAWPAAEGEPDAVEVSQEGENSPEVILEPDDQEIEDGEDPALRPS